MYLTYDDVLLLPAYSEITPPETHLDVLLTSRLLLDIPILASPMDTVCEQEMALAMSQLGGMGIIHRNLSIKKQGDQLEQVLEKGALAAAAVGVGPDFNERAAHLVSVGATVICLDAAHGHSKHVIDKTAYLKDTYPDLEVISGNVTTYEGASALFKAGADVVKVGVGPGSICTTRIVSGVGAPQFTAILESVRAAKEQGKTIIADGGIKAAGDIVKALAAGASAVMLGSLLAGTDEAPSRVVDIEGKKCKSYRGMGSEEAMREGSWARYGLKPSHCMAAQGVVGTVPYEGPVHEKIHLILEGLRAGMAYVGAENIKQLQQKARFIRQSQAGLAESHPSIKEFQT